MQAPWTVIDLFSGCGGMSSGFHFRRGFRLVGAVDLEHGKPCEGAGKLDCNPAYEANLGVAPLAADVGQLDPEELRWHVREGQGVELRPGELTVLSACPPCTDFSRAKPNNHLVDGARNALVVRVGDFVEHFLPRVVVMENAREMVEGRHAHHFAALKDRLRGLGYGVREEVHLLHRFGLAQIRERALVVAVRDAAARGLADLWDGWRVDPRATTVRSAFARLAEWHAAHPGDAMHVAPGLGEDVQRRMEAIPANGGSWRDLVGRPDAERLLIPSMVRRAARGDLGSHPDAYGRMWWDRPAPTLKRECAHVGNGRYAHPELHRLMTVREAAVLQGFPFHYVFASRSVSNRYRHIGDAVPPVVSYQVAAVAEWHLTGRRPTPAEWVLPDSSLRPEDVLEDHGEAQPTWDF